MKKHKQSPGLGWSVASLFSVGELVTWWTWGTGCAGSYEKVRYTGIITDIFAIPEGNRQVFIAEVLPFGETDPIKVGVFRLRKLKEQTN